jgi:hypothetical protein
VAAGSDGAVAVGEGGWGDGADATAGGPAGRATPQEPQNAA